MIKNKVVYIKVFFIVEKFEKHAFNVRKWFFTIKKLLQNRVVK